MADAPLKKSDFANPDARVACPTAGCFGDLVLFPTGQTDVEGIPSFHDATVCPLCGTRFALTPDVDDRSLYLTIAGMRANQHTHLRRPAP